MLMRLWIEQYNLWCIFGTFNSYLSIWSRIEIGGLLVWLYFVAKCGGLFVCYKCKIIFCQAHTCFPPFLIFQLLVQFIFLKFWIKKNPFSTSHGNMKYFKCWQKNYVSQYLYPTRNFLGLENCWLKMSNFNAYLNSAVATDLLWFTLHCF